MRRKMPQKLACRMGMGKSENAKLKAARTWRSCPESLCGEMMDDDKPGMFRSWADALYWLGMFVGIDVLLYYIGTTAAKVLLH